MASDIHSLASFSVRRVAADVKSKRHRVGLLDCYHGGNFGDGAVQDAVIHNLVRRIPGCAVSLISLAPDRTTEIHGVPSHPLTTSVFKSNRNKPNESKSEARISGIGPNSTFFERLRHDPAARRLLRKPWLAARSPFIFAGILADELRHILAIRRLLRDFRLLIVSGGGQLDDYWGGPMGHPYSLLKWVLLAKVGGVPVVFLSVGVDRLENRLSRFFIRVALKLAIYRSYRDAGSKFMLADMPFTHADPVTPDLAFGFDPGVPIPDGSPAGNRNRLRVGISPTAYLLKGHWPRDDASIFQPYFENLVAFAAELLCRGHEIRLFATAEADNFVTTMMMERLQQMLPDRQRVGLRRVAVSRVHDLMPELAGVDLVVATRLHGVILAHLSGKPVLAISADRKVTQHMHDMNQAQYCLDFHHARTTDLQEVFALLSACSPAIRTMLAERVVVFRDLLARQYDCIASLPGR